MAYNERYADFARKGQYPPEFEQQDKRLSDISYHLKRIADALESINKKINNG